MSKKAVVYTRVSTNIPSQMPSLENQRLICEEYASKHDMVVDKVYSDIKSGTEFESRSGLRSLLDDVCADSSNIEVLLVTDTSRLSRSKEDFINILSQLRDDNILIIFIANKLNSYNDDEDLLRVVEIDQEEVLKLRERTKLIRKYQVEHGAVPHSIYGYYKRPHSGAYELQIDEAEAKVVRFVFEQYANGLSSSTICKLLDNAGILTRNGKRFGRHYIRRLISSKIYVGIIQNNKSESVSDCARIVVRKKDRSEWLEHPRPDLRIVPEDLFYKCQNILLRKSTGYVGKDKIYVGWKLPFTGILMCGSCGNTFKRRGNKGKVDFVCSTRDKVCGKEPINCESECINRVSIREDELYNAVRHKLYQVIKSSSMTENDIQTKLSENGINLGLESLFSSVSINDLDGGMFNPLFKGIFVRENGTLEINFNTEMLSTYKEDIKECQTQA